MLMKSSIKKCMCLDLVDLLSLIMGKLLGAALCTALLNTALAATKKEEEALPVIAKVLADFDWEPHEVKTEDGWYLTVIRIKPPKDVEKDPNKLPIMLMHGSMDSVLGFIKDNGWTGAAGGATWSMKMTLKGYEVWILNSRGVKYSNKHDRDGEWSLKEKWAFNWADMGFYDIPAAISHILEVTKAPKVTVAAHSQGTSQMWYSLSHR